MRQFPKSFTLAALGREYGVSRRTLQRYRAAGVNVHSPLEIASHLADLQSPKLEALNRIQKLIALHKT